MTAPIPVRRDVPLAPLTTYRVGGSAAWFATPRTRSELLAVADRLRAGEFASAGHGPAPVVVIGRGSNLLVADSGFPGLVISLAELAADITFGEPDPAVERSEDATVVTAGAAVALPVLARRCAAAGWAGLEWMVGVPGSVGGAVRMNAGGHGADLASCLAEAEILDLRTGATRWVGPDHLGFRFRASGLHDHELVLGARFRLVPGDRTALEAELSEIVRWRREHQPGGQNAGSVFVNPVPGYLSAGELIDRAGLRGQRLGTAHVSEKHANFIQADDGGRAADVVALIELVRGRVADHTGIVLRSEVRLVGFGPITVGTAA